MIIDANMHWLPPELLHDDDLMEKYLLAVPRAYNTYAYLGKIPGTDVNQIMIEKPRGYMALNMGPESIDPKDRLAGFDEGEEGGALVVLEALLVQRPVEEAHQGGNLALVVL